MLAKNLIKNPVKCNFLITWPKPNHYIFKVLVNFHFSPTVKLFFCYKLLIMCWFIILVVKVVSLHVRSNLLEGEGLFTPDRYEPRKCKATTDTPPSELNYVHMLNQNLPEDIWVLSWCPVSEEFTARFVQTPIPTSRLYFTSQEDIVSIYTLLLECCRSFYSNISFSNAGLVVFIELINTFFLWLIWTWR